MGWEKVGVVGWRWGGVDGKGPGGVLVVYRSGVVRMKVFSYGRTLKLHHAE